MAPLCRLPCFGPCKARQSPPGQLLLSTGDWQQENAKAEIGIPVQPLSYVEKACELVHPDLMTVKLIAELEQAVLKQNTALGLELRRERVAWTKFLLPA